MHVRLFPFVIFACVLLLLIKVADVMEGGARFSNNLLVASGYAESKPKEEGHGAEKKEGDKKDAKGEGEDDKKKDKKKDAIKVSETPPEHVVKPAEGPQFTPAEVEVLQRLRQRREQLDTREKELDVREKVLRVTETKIDQKIADLNLLKGKVEEILNAYNGKEEAKLASLVKIYENMKPKDAARIFDTLEMTTLLPVMDKMKEAKVALILAQMDAQKARDITTQLSQMRKLPTKQ